MDRFDVLERGFARAGLPLKRRKTAFGFGPQARRAFFCEIVRKDGPEFSVWPGDESNTVIVLDADPGLRQLVLMVKEAEGQILVREYDDRLRKRVTRTVRVSAQKRKFLVDFDERDLFLAQLPDAAPATTVKQAHAVLRNPELPDARAVKVQRQGEWFFVPATAEELAWISESQAFIKKKSRLGGWGPGKPHVADEYLGGDPMFARGSVRHADHAPVRLKGWHRVLPNMENRGPGAKWID